MSEEKTYREQWHLDKKVPLALIAVLVVQTFGAAWFLSRLDSRVEMLEAADRRSEIRFTMIGSDRERLVRVEEKVSAQTDILKDIKQTLDRRQPPPERQH